MLLRPLRPSPARHSFAWNWLSFAGVLAALTLTWSVSTPLPSGPDETTHFVKAAAVVRGQLGGVEVPQKRDLVRVRVPAAVAEVGKGRPCYYRPPTRSAACDRSAPPPSAGTIDAATYVGNYPPLYYALTGWPSLLSTSRLGLRAMRATTAVVCSVLLGLAFATARRWSDNRLLPLGLAFGLSPAAVYLSSVLNPNGLEIAAAAVLWTSATILVLERAADPPRGLVLVCTAAAVVLALTRPLSPLFAVAILLALGVLRPRSARLLLRARPARIGAGVIAAVVALAMVFVLVRQSYIVEQFPVRPGTSTAEVVRLSVLHVATVTKELFGAFGSPNFGAPFAVLLLWGGGAAVLLGSALLLLGRRDAALLGVGLVLLLLCVPLAIDLASARTNGIAWQGRYELPLALGFPVLAAALLGTRGVRAGRAHVLAPVVLAVGLGISYFWVVRRYQVGLAGPLDPFPGGPDVWQPPLPGGVLLPAAVVLTVLYALLVHRAARPEPRAAPASGTALETVPETAEPVTAATVTGSAER